MGKDKTDSFLQADMQKLRGQFASLRHTVQAMADREQQLGALVLPDPYEDETSDERIRNLEQKVATLLGQPQELYKPVLLPSRLTVHSVAKITDEGPDSEADYTDEKYWVIEQRIKNTSGTNVTDLAFEDKPSGLHVTATDLGDTATEGHALATDGSVYVLLFRGTGQEVDSETGKLKPVTHYYFRGPASGTYDTPDAIGRTPEGAEAADTDTWDRTNPTEGKDGVSKNILTGVGYHDAGDEKLYGYYCTFTFDSIGLLATISAETRYEIDTLVECP